MDMKKYNMIIWIFTVFFTTISCSDWLDVRPRNEMKEDDMYANEEGFKSALTGAYINWQPKNFMAGMRPCIYLRC